MTFSLDWYSAPNIAGSIDGRGLRKLLGASVHDRLSLLIRETVQNSWDASRYRDGRERYPDRVADFAVDLRTASDEERLVLDEMFGPDPVPGLPLREVLDAPVLRVLEISDRGTAGLGGPTDDRRDIPEGVTTDFIDLMFKIGAPQDKEFGGGTFGFGKIASYAVSKASTIIVRSNPMEGAPGSPASERLIASGIGDSFSLDGYRYTGRHWWGTTHDDYIHPLEGHRAHEIATEVFHHPFRGDETGTSILVVQPDLEGLSSEEAATRIISAILWNAWPKLLPHPGDVDPPMRISVSVEGEDVPIPDPRTTRPFIGFCASLQEVRRRQADGIKTGTPWRLPENREPYTRRQLVKPFDSGNPQIHVGVAAVTESLDLRTVPRWEGDEEERQASGVGDKLHHLALMRQAELVVTYVSGPEHPEENEHVEWSGVFRADVGVDDHFADAEPPAHDDWLAGGLSSRNAKVAVNRGRTKGPRELFARMFARDQRQQQEGEGEGLARLVDDHLKGLFDTGRAPTPGRSSGPSGGGTGSGIQVVEAQPSIWEGSDVLVIDFTAPKETRVRAEGRVKLASRASGDPVDVIGFATAGSEGPVNFADELETGDQTKWRVWFHQPPGSTVRASIRESG